MYKPINGIHDVLRFGDPIEADPDPVVRHARRMMNRAIWGSLEIEFISRRVTFTNIRGDHAMRFHGLVSDHRDGDPSSARWADQLDPPTADAGSRWITFDPSKVLAINWEPERLLHGNEQHKARLAFAARVLMTHQKKPDITSWTPAEMADYLVILDDIEMPVEPAAETDDEPEEPEGEAEPGDSADPSPADDPKPEADGDDHGDD
jgi:hypothetical protein